MLQHVSRWFLREVEIGMQKGPTPARKWDPPGEGWHRWGSRCGGDHSGLLDFFAFIDSRNR
jgi:hypothetical protein